MRLILSSFSRQLKRLRGKLKCPANILIIKKEKVIISSHQWGRYPPDRLKSEAWYISWWAPRGPCGRPWWSPLEQRQKQDCCSKSIIWPTASHSLSVVGSLWRHSFFFSWCFLTTGAGKIFSHDWGELSGNLQFSSIASAGFLAMGLSGMMCTERTHTDTHYERKKG